MTWINTYSGQKYEFASPNRKLICIEDIAHALGNTCRFGGHCKFFYSVAQHSVLCATVALNVYKNPKLAQHVFLHDASEAYVGDMVGPLKREIPRYQQLEDISIKTIYDHLGVDYIGGMVDYKDKIKEIDMRMLFTEKSVLFSNKFQWDDEDKYERFKIPEEVFIKISTPERDKQEFKKMYCELFRNDIRYRPNK